MTRMILVALLLASLMGCSGSDYAYENRKLWIDTEAFSDEEVAAIRASLDEWCSVTDGWSCIDELTDRPSEVGGKTRTGIVTAAEECSRLAIAHNGSVTFCRSTIEGQAKVFGSSTADVIGSVMLHETGHLFHLRDLRDSEYSGHVMFWQLNDVKLSLQEDDVAQYCAVNTSAPVCK